MRKNTLIFFFVGLLVAATVVLNSACNQDSRNSNEEFPLLSGPYLGQKSPGRTPEIFAPRIVSTGYNERGPAFNPDGKEMFYCLYGAPFGVILQMEEVNGRWTKPRVASFSGRYGGEMTLSPDGNTVVFSSNQPFENSPSLTDYWIWKTEKEGSDWSSPKPLGPTVNSGKFAGYPSLSNSGNLYFFSERDDGRGGADIYVSAWVEGQYAESVNLGDSINTNLDDVDPAIAPDESYVIFSRRKENGVLDLFISFRMKDGSWSEARNMEERINSDASEFCPVISADGKYLFFTSTRSLFPAVYEAPITYEEKIRILNSPGNGNSDIYWVDAQIIEDFRNDSGKKMKR